ncbi:MAG: hypothetical protein NW215_00675 [Hyphomicrobiales bacterium]|nr:hypothetical protein [Hyphomicrobiales bacterium]
MPVRYHKQDLVSMRLLDRMLATLSGTDTAAAAPKADWVTTPNRYTAHLDTPLLHFTNADPWTLRHACAGTHIFGANGSGKTTGSGRAFALSFLSHGFGGVVLCAKPDEAQRWIEYARATNRLDDVVWFTPHQHWRFNFLDYEMQRPAIDPASRVENLLSTLLNIMEQSGRDQGGEESQFWIGAAELLLRNALLVLAPAHPNFTLFDLQLFIDTAPRSRDDARDPSFDSTPCAQALNAARAAYQAAGREDDFRVIANYWLMQYPSLPERTRGSVIFTLGTMLQDVQTGTIRELFCTATNIFPEDTHEGAIIILDLPAVASRTNRMAQTLFKTVWQQATLRRTMTQATRPVFLWADEAHFFVTPYDTDFQSLARDRRACTVYMTQNLSAYHQRLPSRNAQAMTAAFMGYFQTQVFHALSDPTTIQHAQFLFGKTDRFRESSQGSTTYGTNDGSSRSYNFGSSSGEKSWSVNSGHGTTTNTGTSRSRTTGWGLQHAVEDTLRPEDFTALKTGGPETGNRVGAFCFKTGTTWSHGSTCLYAEFPQR